MPSILRTAAPSGDWRSFKFTHEEAGVTYIEGSIYKIGDTIGVLLLDIQYTAAGCKEAKEIEEDDEGVLYYHAEKIMVDKKSGSFGVGDKVYWGGTQGDGVESHYQSTEYWIGICVRAAALADSQVMIDLKGDKASITEPL